MSDLPVKAKIYLISIYFFGVMLISYALFFSPVHRPALSWEMALFLSIAIFAYGKKITLMRHKGVADAGSMSLGFAITFAAILRLGPTDAMIVAAVGCLSSCLYPKRQPPYQVAFNVLMSAAQAWVTGWLFTQLNGGTLNLQATRAFVPVAAASLTYFAINTFPISIIIGLCSGQNILKIWRTSFMWTAPSYFAGACVSTLATLLCGHQSGAMLLFVLPVAYLTYQSYATTIGRSEEKQQHIERLADLYLSTIKSLALAIDAKDQYTHQHILRVQRYAVAIAKQLGLDGDDLEAINTGALLHDIGKLGVPEYVLLKPGRLTEEEFATIKKHPEIGAAILDPVEFPWPVLPVVKHHHERWDGKGYPDGLAGENIPRSARILSVADVYDALTSNRSYRHAWEHHRAVEEITRSAGTQFDPVIVEAFLSVIEGVVAEMAAEKKQTGEQQAPQVVTTVKSDEAVRHIQRASSDLWALYEVAQTLSSSLGLSDTLEILGRKLGTILPNTACLFLLKSDQSEALVVRTAVGINSEFLLGAQTVNESSISYTVAHSQQTYLGEFDLDDLLMVNSPTSAWEPMQTCLIVPVVHQGEVLGTINLYHPQAGAFGPHDRHLLETIASRAAMALYNGILFDRTRSHAFTDPLTGLFNVRYLTQYVEERCKPMSGQPEPFALLCLDLDSFKPINDNFGHQKGDKVLRDLSALFQENIREGDIAARYGGDEFLIVLHGAGMEEAKMMAHRLCQLVEAYDPGLVHERLGVALHLGVSIGYGCFPQDGQDCASLISAADAQMYHEKTDRKLGKLISSQGSDAAEPDTILRLSRAA